MMEHMVAQEDSKILKYLSMGGEERLQVKDEVTAGIHSLIGRMQSDDNIESEIVFLSSSVKKPAGDERSWVEYEVLIGIPKCNGLEYTSYNLKELSEVLTDLNDVLSGLISSSGIEEVNTSLSDYDYFLFYLIGDGE